MRSNKRNEPARNSRGERPSSTKMAGFLTDDDEFVYVNDIWVCASKQLIREPHLTALDPFAYDSTVFRFLSHDEWSYLVETKCG